MFGRHRSTPATRHLPGDETGLRIRDRGQLQPMNETKKQPEPTPSLLFVWLGGPLLLLLISGGLSYLASFFTGDSAFATVVSILTLIPEIYIVGRKANDRGGSAVTVVKIIFAAFLYSVIVGLIFYLILLSILSALGFA